MNNKQNIIFVFIIFLTHYFKNLNKINNNNKIIDSIKIFLKLNLIEAVNISFLFKNSKIIDEIFLTFDQIDHNKLANKYV